MRERVEILPPCERVAPADGIRWTLPPPPDPRAYHKPVPRSDRRRRPRPPGEPGRGRFVDLSA